MQQLIEDARRALDSIGGVVECCAVGLSPGIGSPIFDNIESVISSLLFSIPGVKGVSFGAGFDAAGMYGSRNNDPFLMREGKIATQTNHHGGILGGISSGMPITLKAAFKPTPSIAREQDTVDFVRKTDKKLTVTGRHDACIAVRGVPLSLIHI